MVFFSLFFLLFRSQARCHSFNGFMLLCMSGIILYFLTNENFVTMLTDRFTGKDHFSLTDTQYRGFQDLRFILWHNAWNIFLDHWLTGVGLGNIRSVMQQTIGIDFDSHQLFLDILSEQGIIVFLVFISLVISPIYWIYKTKNVKTPNRDLGIALYVGMLGFVLYGCITGARIISTINYYSGHCTYFLFISILLQHHLIVRSEFNERRFQSNTACNIEVNK